MKQTQHIICLLVGSNIRAEDNLPRSVELLRKHVTVLETSSVWESQAVGSDGPNFLNAALLASTMLDAPSLKEQVLLPLEAKLGRVRTNDKNAPRTIDIDLILYDHAVLDPHLWRYAHIAAPVAEILPDLQSEDGTSLRTFASNLVPSTSIRVRDDISDYPFLTVFKDHNDKEAKEMEKTKISEVRSKYAEIAPEGVAILGKLEHYIKMSGLEPQLIELVKLRASQINGCAFCIDMHTKDARNRGESEQRLYALSAWRETPFYSARECSALEWAEAVTKVSQDHVPDELYDRVRQHFTEKELVDLTLAVIAINSWNRLAISFRALPGSYLPDHPLVKKG